MKQLDGREQIDTELDRNLVVEAAAGTGKTTKLVDRIVGLISSGRARIGEIVAVTFSEKAAGELKLRLRERLEVAHRDPRTSDAASDRLSRAAHDFEEAHISTIHGFCVELLRERPVEAAVDPSFQVLAEGLANQLFSETFRHWLQQELTNPREGVRRFLRRRTKPVFGETEDNGPINRLSKVAIDLREWRHYTAEWGRPTYDRERVIRTLIQQLRDFSVLTKSPLKRGDAFSVDMQVARNADSEIQRLQRQVGDMVPPGMFDLWEAILVDLASTYKFRKGFKKGSGNAFALGITRDQVLSAHGALLAALESFKSDADADIAALLHSELSSCFDLFEERKNLTGGLDFNDLLVKTRDLLQNNSEVRTHLQSKYRVVLIDEFQDTDSVQAQLLLALVTDDSNRVQPGRLFVVGDPKQSIYRFRRADIGAYQEVIDSLERDGALRIILNRSFRSVPQIQNFINAAFSTQMTSDSSAQQAGYVPLAQDRDDFPSQPSVIALPVPRPYNFREVTQTQLMSSEPGAVAEFVRWMLSDACTWTLPHGDERRTIKASDICILLRRFVHFEKDLARIYMDELEARGVAHLLVGGKSFHRREEVEAVRNAITAIEWPENELAVYAALQGPLFAHLEHELLEYHFIAGCFHPYRIANDLPQRLSGVGESLAILRKLHGARNHRPVADTIERLLSSTRAHAAFALWNGGEQALANVLQVIELAKRYESEGGLSFRGFVDLLLEAQTGSDSREAPVLEEGSDGVRIMSLHKAKGLEFPIVILADMACQISRDDASRFLDSKRNLCAIRTQGLSPVELIINNTQEALRDKAEGVRLAYVAATRARDILVVTAVGDGPQPNSWLSPLYGALYPPKEQRQSPTTARGVPIFKGKDTVIPEARPSGQVPDALTVRPGTFAVTDPNAGSTYSVTWWDPLTLIADPTGPKGIRREDLISKDADPIVVAGDRATYDRWREHRAAVQAAGSVASMNIATATQLSEGSATPKHPIAIEDAGFGALRPSGKRFGTLVHALLATLQLDASASSVKELAALHAKLFAASDEEQAAAAAIANKLLMHPRLVAARAAEKAGRRVWREAPISLRTDNEVPQIVDGQVDLAYETEDGWVIVDFKTDIEIASAQDAYKQQVALYVEAVQQATGQKASGVLLRV